MGMTIKGKLSELLSDIDLTEAYLESIGLKLAFDIYNQIFSIELKENPEVHTQLKDAGWFSDEIQHLDITGITEGGVSLYLSHPKAGDAYIYIPRENILSIHTVDEQFIKDVETFAPERLPPKGQKIKQRILKPPPPRKQL